MSSYFVHFFFISHAVSCVSQKVFDEELGKKIAERRRAIPLSQEFVATILRKDQTFISKVETGRRTLSLFEFIRYSKALNLSKDEVINLIESLKDHAD